MNTKQYTQPPLVEAICAFQFVPGSPWDVTIFGLVYDRIKTKFPAKFPAPVSAPPGRIQFRRADNTALVQLAPDSLTVNHLTPYCGWLSFRAMIEEVLAAYQSVAEPQGLSGISLRYINRLSIPAASTNAEEDDVEIQQYLLTHPTVPEGVPQIFSEWAHRVVIPFEAARQTLVVQAGTAQGSEEFPVVFMLDLEARPQEEQRVSLAEAMLWLEGAHANVETVFETCLGPRARALFGEAADQV